MKIIKINKNYNTRISEVMAHITKHFLLILKTTASIEGVYLFNFKEKHLLNMIDSANMILK